MMENVIRKVTRESANAHPTAAPAVVPTEIYPEGRLEDVTVTAAVDVSVTVVVDASVTVVADVSVTVRVTVTVRLIATKICNN
jgi:hypothetical protein